MASLLDMMLEMQNGDAVQQLSRQFQLSQEQTVTAMEALMPAFSTGLKRNAADPYGIANFFNALATGQHGNYVDNMMAAFKPQGVTNGNAILGHLFGSPDVSRAVAAQASALSGVSPDILKQMLPVLANLIMGGLFKQTTGQMGNAGMFGAAGNPIGELIEQMMRQGGMPTGTPQRTPRAEPQNPFDNPFGKVLEEMFGGGQRQPQQPQRRPEPQGNPMGDNPLGRIFEEMITGYQRGMRDPEPEPEPEPEPRPRTNPSGRPRNPYDDLFGEMFESGAKTRDGYEENIKGVFDKFLRGMDKHR